MSLHLIHRFGPTLTYPSTSHLSDNTAGVSPPVYTVASDVAPMLSSYTFFILAPVLNLLLRVLDTRYIPFLIGLKISYELVPKLTLLNKI